MALPLRSDDPPRRFPVATFTLLVVNVVVFLFVQPAGFQSSGSTLNSPQERIWIVQDRDEFAARWGAVACELTTGDTLAEDPPGCRGERAEVLPRDKSVLFALLTHLFLHGDILHLAGNMLFLWVFGRNVEDRLGRANFLILYIVGGIVATMGFVATNASAASPLIGASGAIAVAMGAYLVLFPRGRVLTVIATVAFQVVYVPAAVVLILFFVTQFFTADDNIAWEAHAAGMVVGVLAALVLSRIPAIRQRGALDRADAELRAGVEF